MAEKYLSMIDLTGIMRFDGNKRNFKVWKIRVENALKLNKSWAACCSNFDIEESGKEAINEELNIKAKHIILSTITDNVLRKVYKELAKEMWTLLIESYEKYYVREIFYIKKKFFELWTNGKRNSKKLS